MIGIYKITNPKGKIYIGLSTNIEARFNSYKRLHCKDQPLIYDSLLNYGVDKHKFEIIKKCSIDKLSNFEIKYIKKFKSNLKRYGLNLTTGGHRYFKHNKATRLKMSKAQIGNTKNLGKKQSQETIEKRVKKLKGQKRTKAFKKRHSKLLTGRKFSQETIDKSAATRKEKGCNTKKVIDTSTGIIYKRCQDAADILKMKKSTLIAKLNGQNPNTTTLKYY